MNINSTFIFKKKEKIAINDDGEPYYADKLMKWKIVFVEGNEGREIIEWEKENKCGNFLGVYYVRLITPSKIKKEQSPFDYLILCWEMGLAKKFSTSSFQVKN